MRPSFSSSNQVSKFTSDFKFQLDSCGFPSSAILTSDETKLKKLNDTKKNGGNLKKRFSILKGKLKVRKAKHILSKKKGSKSFIKTLNSFNSFYLSASSPTSCSLSPFEYSLFNISSNHLVPKFKCLFEHCDFNPGIDENVFESETLSLSSHTLFESSSRDICKPKFKHLKNSRFTSTSIIFGDR